MSLRDDVKRLLDREENAGTLLADYLAGCLNAYEPNSWQQAVATRAQWERIGRYGAKIPRT